jgi:hypothetical protein
MGFTEIKDRWTAATPGFFKKIIVLSKSAGAAGGALVAPALAPGIHWPPILSTIGGGLIVIGTVAGSVSKLTVQDTNDIKN